MFLFDISVSRRLLLKAIKIIDLGVLLFSFVIACGVVHCRSSALISFEQFFAIRLSIQNIILLFLLVGCWHLIFSLFGLYGSRRLSPFCSEVHDIIRATFVGTLLLYLAGWLFSIELVTLTFLVVFWLLSCGITVTGRLVLRLILRRVRLKGRNLRQVLIVGTGKTAMSFARTIEEKKYLGYELIGFVGDAWVDDRQWQDARGKSVLIKFNDFAGYLRNSVVDEVVICLPVVSFYPQYSQVVAACNEQGVIVRFVSDIFTSKFSQLKREQFDEYSVVTLYTGGMVGWPVVLKRLLDIVGSSMLLLLNVPVFIGLALAIKLTSEGPVFFLQERIGLNKRRFRVIKFRTMIVDAETKITELEKDNEMSGPVFKIRNDPRITKVGKFLRKTSMDEIPQLINVLKGDMSLVGPRPLPVRDYQGFDHDWHRRRFSVRPGITCIWQVEGRNSIPFEKWMELDLYYIDHWSLWLDLKILLKTFPAILTGS